MDRRRFLAVGGCGLALIAGCLSQIRGNEPEGENTERETTDSLGSDGGFTIEATGVEIYHYAQESWFDPIGLHVPVDTTVTWIHTGDGAPAHEPIAYENRIPAGAERFVSRSMTEGETFEHTFSVPGTYDYYCGLHRSEFGMVGRVVCDEPGGPAETSENPHGDLPSSDMIMEMGSVPRNSDF